MYQSISKRSRCNQTKPMQAMMQQEQPSNKARHTRKKRSEMASVGSVFGFYCKMQAYCDQGHPLQTETFLPAKINRVPPFLTEFHQPIKHHDTGCLCVCVDCLRIPVLSNLWTCIPRFIHP